VELSDQATGQVVADAVVPTTTTDTDTPTIPTTAKYTVLAE
jgi:hypothetical protein